MDKNTFTGLFLILVIMVASTYLIQPPPNEIKREQQHQDAMAKAQAGNQGQDITDNIPREKANVAFRGPFGSASVGNDRIVTLENDHLKINIHTKGGYVASVQLKGYRTYDHKPVIMFDTSSAKFGLNFSIAGTNLSTANLYFKPSADSIYISKSDSMASLRMRLDYKKGKYIEYVYTLKKQDFKLGFNLVLKGMQEVIKPKQQRLVLNWEILLKQKEKDMRSEQRYSTAYYMHQKDNTVDYLSAVKDEEKELNEGKIQWVAFKQHFFSNVLIAKKGFENGSVGVTMLTAPGNIKLMKANMELPCPTSSIATYPMEFYFGPNKFSTLQAQGYRLERLVDLGYWPLKYINRYLVLPVFNLLERFHWTYGLIILTLTILVKVVLSPLTYKSYLSMAKMRVLKPEMDQIKAKVGDKNPALLQQEYLKLYKKAGVNPLGGCIPMLLQLPVVMAFFFFFPNLFELRQESFLWMEDLSTFDSFISFSSIPLLGMDHISLMCVLMTGSQLVYAYFNNQTSGVTGQMKFIGYISPIIFFGILNSYPSGLNYYYFLANMLTFLQQFIIRQLVNDEKIHAQIQENKKKPEVIKKKSSFQKRMEQYMRQQQMKAQETQGKKIQG